MPADIPRSEPPDEYEGSFLSFVVLDAAAEAKPESVPRISEWVESKLADFCRLTSEEVHSQPYVQHVSVALVCMVVFFAGLQHSIGGQANKHAQPSCVGREYAQ